MNCVGEAKTSDKSGYRTSFSPFFIAVRLCVFLLTHALCLGKILLSLPRQEDTSPLGDACRAPCPGNWEGQGKVLL